MEARRNPEEARLLKNTQARERRAKKQSKKTAAPRRGLPAAISATVEVAVPPAAAHTRSAGGRIDTDLWPPQGKTEPGVEVTQSEAQLIERMKAKVLEIGVYQREEEQTRGKHKSAKDSLEQARDDLVEMVRAVNRDEPLTDRMEKDGWKRVKIEDAIGISLGRRVIEGASPILKGDTLGGLTAFIKDHQLTDCKGIGSGTASKIEDAMEAFWKRNGHWTKDQ